MSFIIYACEKRNSTSSSNCRNKNSLLFPVFWGVVLLLIVIPALVDCLRRCYALHQQSSDQEERGGEGKCAGPVNKRLVEMSPSIIVIMDDDQKPTHIGVRSQ
ncbi:hypothetical protein P3L10_006967 [Capsicum annuum]